MPSWKLHKKWGEIICGFSSEEIDRLIDNPKQHDAGRYDRKIFLDQIEYVSSKYGLRGVEYYLLHHLLDMLKDELVAITSRYGKISLELIRLECIKPEVIENNEKYEVIWEHLVTKLKPKLPEIVIDIISEEGFKRSYGRTIINQYVASCVKSLLIRLPPCIPIGSVDRVFINSHSLKVVWNYISNHKHKGLEVSDIDRCIKESLVEYIKDHNLFEPSLCSKKCKEQVQRNNEYRRFIKSLEIPCPYI